MLYSPLNYNMNMETPFFLQKKVPQEIVQKSERLPLPESRKEQIQVSEQSKDNKDSTGTSFIEISPEYFGKLWKYIEDDDITVIDYNGYGLWIQDFNNRKKKVEDVEIPPLFIEQFTQRIANSVSKEFNKQNPILEAETERLRISIFHESVAVTGRSVCIRKTLPMTRIHTKEAIESGYVSREVLCFLINCIKAHMNIIVCGGVGVGKTECAKYISQYIPDEERVITIEDNLEWRYHQINPDADCVEMQVSDILSYEDAIIASLRHDPKWLMVSEVRGEEVTAYIKQLTTGVNGITTLHTDDARKVPNRLVNMASDNVGKDRMESDIFSFLDVAILLNLRREDGIEKRFIDQICIFSNDMGNNQSRLIVNNGMLVTTSLSDEMQLKFEKVGILEPFRNEEILKELSKENAKEKQTSHTQEQEKQKKTGSKNAENHSQDKTTAYRKHEKKQNAEQNSPISKTTGEELTSGEEQKTVSNRTPRARKQERGI